MLVTPDVQVVGNGAKSLTAMRLRSVASLRFVKVVVTPPIVTSPEVPTWAFGHLTVTPLTSR